MRHLGINDSLKMCNTYTLKTTKYCWEKLKKRAPPQEKPDSMGR